MAAKAVGAELSAEEVVPDPVVEQAPPAPAPEAVDTSTPFVACTNCGGQAVFTLGDVVNIVQYCPYCLPSHFVADASKGLYPLVVPG